MMGGLLAIPRAFYQAVLRGAERMGGPNIVNVASQAAQQFGIYFLAVGGVGLVALAWWVTAWFAVSTVTSLLIASRAVPAGSLRPGWDAVSVRRHRGFAGSMAAVSATSVVQVQGDESAVELDAAGPGGRLLCQPVRRCLVGPNRSSPRPQRRVFRP